MSKGKAQFSLTFLMLVVACTAVNLWLFRQGIFWGIVGLNVSKHVIIAYLCKSLGVNRTIEPGSVDPFAEPEPGSH
jgi:hypothetical protein